MKVHGIPASITIAQGILESGAGFGSLAKEANNHFGIKCHTGWTGESVKYDDDAEQECFRKYKDPTESYKDHSLFLSSRKRYESLFKLDKGDYESWANGLKQAGYATDTLYPSKLIGIIERYELYKIDNEVLGRSFIPKPRVVPQVQVIGEHIVEKGDTLYSLSKKYNIPVEELKSLNAITDSEISIGQKLIVKK
jgi:LysM repeat protein